MPAIISYPAISGKGLGHSRDQTGSHHLATRIRKIHPRFRTKAPDKNPAHPTISHNSSVGWADKVLLSAFMNYQQKPIVAILTLHHPIFSKDVYAQHWSHIF